MLYRTAWDFFLYSHIYIYKVRVRAKKTTCTSADKYVYFHGKVPVLIWISTCTYLAKYVYLFGKRPVRGFATIRIALIFTNVHFDTPQHVVCHFFFAFSHGKMLGVSLLFSTFAPKKYIL